jgi:hypothetical protein
MMRLDYLARIIITGALFSQLLHIIYVNKQIYAPAFIIYAIASYMMAYQYYKDDKFIMTSRLKFKLFNSTILMLIGLLSMR